ncbi:MAG: hypothetical protein BKP49_06745 [Treponema sp. CETP13]|nr:MAG: hypothetical protein BKP49_06745 [Treponema sp. CETP13]
MKKGICRRFVILLVFYYILFSFSVFAQTVSDENESYLPRISIEAANTKTALRCLDLARNYLLDEQWDRALQQAEFGLKYNANSADLWYIQAIALKKLNKPISEILLPLQNALSQNNWLYWNRDAARIMLAEMYLKTGKSKECLELLNTSPELVLREAQYLRAQALYDIGDILTARSIITATATIYPEDSRFALLFFSRELMRPEFSLVDAEMANLATTFLKRTDELSFENIDILLYASQFTDCLYPEDKNASKDLCTRLLKEWKAKGSENWLYGTFALKCGLISEQEALDYLNPWFTNLDKNTIEYKKLEEFALLLNDKDVCEKLRVQLEAFSGTITFDLNKDTIVDVGVLYNDGRPKTIVYDQNQDGILTWLAECDFGVPYKVTYNEKKLQIIYGDWPAISSMQDSTVEYQLVPDTLFWSPVEIMPAPVISSVIDEEFYIPIIKNIDEALSTEQLYNISNKITVPSTEKESSSITYIIKNGILQNATWIENSQPYAYGVFKDGILQFRNVDVNLDGFYEICEVYGYDPDNIEKYVPLQKGLFGTIPKSEFTQLDGLYLSELVIDNDLNSIPEYTELFLQNGGRLCRWYTDNDEKWDFEYVEFQDGKMVLSRFRNPVLETIVEIEYEDGIPVQVIDNGIEKDVLKDPDSNFYWIGKNPGKGIAKKLQEKLNLTKGSGVYKITVSEEINEIDNNSFRIIAVCYGDLYFGEIIER